MVKVSVNLVVVELAGLGQLPLPADGGVDAAQMRQGGCICQPVQHLQAKAGPLGSRTHAIASLRTSF